MIFCEPISSSSNYLKQHLSYNNYYNQPWTMLNGSLSSFVRGAVSPTLPETTITNNRPSYLNLNNNFNNNSSMFSSLINTSPTSPTYFSTSFSSANNNPQGNFNWNNNSKSSGDTSPIEPDDQLKEAKTSHRNSSYSPPTTLSSSTNNPTAIANNNYLNALTNKIVGNMEQNFQDNNTSAANNLMSGNGSSMARVNSQNAIQTYNASSKHDPPVLASPIASRRDFGTLVRQPSNNNSVNQQQQQVMATIPQSHGQIQQGYAYAHPGPHQPATKMLIDPNTGQQYFVPTAHTQMAYYPVYYANAPVPPPPPTQPIFYQHVQASPAPQLATSPSHHQQSSTQPIFFGNDSMVHQQQQQHSHGLGFASSPPNRQQQQQQNYLSSFGNSPVGGYRVEIPPSSASSVCDTHNISPSSYFQRNHESRVSGESASATSSVSNTSKNKHSDDSMSPPANSNPNSSRSTNNESLLFESPRLVAQQNRNFNLSNTNNNNNNTNRYTGSTTTSSSSTSGFASGGGDSFTEKSKLLLTRTSDNSHQQQQQHHHSPQYGQESGGMWWGGGGGMNSPRNPLSQTTSPHNSPSKYLSQQQQQQFRQQSSTPPEQQQKQQQSHQIQQQNFSSEQQQENFSLSKNLESQPKPLQKPIRMDIDFNRPISPEQPKSQQISVKANIRNPPTAFTVNFDDLDGDVDSRRGSREKTPTVSLQDAAKKAPTGRRLMRRITPAATNRNSIPPSTSLLDGANSNNNNGNGGDPKHYLFTKMIQGYNKKSAHDALTTSHFSNSSNEHRDCDVLSEAGTYIVENKSNRMQNSINSQLLTSDDECSNRSSTSSSSSTISESGTSIRNGKTPPETKIGPPLAPLITMAQASNVKRSLMTDLRRLREGNLANTLKFSPRLIPSTTTTTPITTTNSQQPSTSRAIKSGLGSTTVGVSQVPPIRPCYKQQQQQISPQIKQSFGSSTNNGLCVGGANSKTTSNSMFRRGDGGRFSMRSSASSTNSSTQRPSRGGGGCFDGAAAKPPFRTGIGGQQQSKQSLKPTSSYQHQDSPEMVAWLRRKEYDPRKAAAEARKLQQLKQRLLNLAGKREKDFSEEDSDICEKELFTANRSISYQVAGAAGSPQNSAFKQWRKPMLDERSNKSYDNLSRLGEETEEFNQMTLGESSNSLKKTVDELTQKCYKSIELIRLCNKNSLSESVEHLLERVVDSTTATTTTTSSSSSSNRRHGTLINSNQSKQQQQQEQQEEQEAPENISNRLEMLSSAFDAIQKYLEEQSIVVGPSSNITTSQKTTQIINKNPPSGGPLLNQSFNRPRTSSGSSSHYLGMGSGHSSIAGSQPYVDGIPSEDDEHI